jgi:hypothetical protein
LSAMTDGRMFDLVWERREKERLTVRAGDELKASSKEGLQALPSAADASGGDRAGEPAAVI